jgi:hypothetical protein
MTGQVEILVLRSGHADALMQLFEEISRDAASANLHPHPFDAEWTERICRYQGKDLYFGLLHDGAMVGYGMLRGWDDGYDVPVTRTVDHEASSIERCSEGLARVAAQVVVDRVVVRPEKHECRNAHQQSASGLEHAQPIPEIRGFVGDVLKHIRGHQEITRSIRVSRVGRIHHRRVG